MYSLAVADHARQARPGDLEELPAERPYAHLDALLGGVVARRVLEPRQVKVAAELGVYPAEHVEVELGRHAPRVVVGRLQDAAVLDQVQANQERVAGAHRGAQDGQKVGAVSGVKVAKARAQERDKVRRAAEPPDELEAAAVRVDDPRHGQPVVLAYERAAAGRHHVRDVDRDVLGAVLHGR